ncbi:alpha/beta hydrolase-fold protein [Amycolatopsis sp. PS_44_ISF1]|uniref:alpha/beta hydrolase n=1 Tax=Amycolatopsis sp. PS_44_ISF1 TaxID=2974917 RepID=UPI0028DD8A01|nr:alpha/beta hydrolase-fold protein [Amycolatopsis sp. PS_44_ISF1]MDT8912026.1 alpha/beta hydrolase-fold protein [Amycolatopsis sp. PS_44_ISF1]
MRIFSSTLNIRIRLAAAATGLAAASLLTGPTAHAETGSPPALTDGYGLTQVGRAEGSPTNFVVTVTTPEVSGPHHIRIVVPGSYYTDPGRRFPVFYFLPGVGDDPGRPGLAYPALLAARQMITVIPDGGLRGWYTDWARQDTAAGAQKWETFHLGQVVPFIDANFRTVTARTGRAVGGLSMGGFGALNYAENHPELFSQAVSLSGALDLGLYWVRTAIRGTLSNSGFALSGTSGSGDTPGGSTFGPAVPTDSVFGSLDEAGDLSAVLAHSPVAKADRLAGVGISLYTGAGDGNLLNLLRDEPAFAEAVTEAAQRGMKAALDRLGHPAYAVDYGNGQGWGPNCQGKHASGCWAQDLVDYVPRLERSFAGAA